MSMGNSDASKGGGSMRPTQLPLPRLVPPLSRPSAGRQAEGKAPAEAKPPKKRSLNEAAHKLSY